ncbi:hypothetical protein SNEBB_010229 [Seison nebaliae]|nr:hypothetical protein SNEBB_010229 [Seison nebaliae]
MELIDAIISSTQQQLNWVRKKQLDILENSKELIDEMELAQMIVSETIRLALATLIYQRVMEKCLREMVSSRCSIVNFVLVEIVSEIHQQNTNNTIDRYENDDRQHKFIEYCRSSSGKQVFLSTLQYIFPNSPMEDQYINQTVFSRLQQHFSLILFQCYETDNYEHILQLINKCFSYYTYQALGNHSMRRSLFINDTRLSITPQTDSRMSSLAQDSNNNLPKLTNEQQLNLKQTLAFKMERLAKTRPLLGYITQPFSMIESQSTKTEEVIDLKDNRKKSIIEMKKRPIDKIRRSVFTYHVGQDGFRQSISNVFRRSSNVKLENDDNQNPLELDLDDDWTDEEYIDLDEANIIVEEDITDLDSSNTRFSLPALFTQRLSNAFPFLQPKVEDVQMDESSNVTQPEKKEKRIPMARMQTVLGNIGEENEDDENEINEPAAKQRQTVPNIRLSQSPFLSEMTRDSTESDNIDEAFRIVANETNEIPSHYDNKLCSSDGQIGVENIHENSQENYLSKSAENITGRNFNGNFNGNFKEDSINNQQEITNEENDDRNFQNSFSGNLKEEFNENSTRQINKNFHNGNFSIKTNENLPEKTEEKTIKILSDDNQYQTSRTNNQMMEMEKEPILPTENRSQISSIFDNFFTNVKDKLKNSSFTNTSTYTEVEDSSPKTSFFTTIGNRFEQFLKIDEPIDAMPSIVKIRVNPRTSAESTITTTSDDSEERSEISNLPKPKVSFASSLVCPMNKEHCNDESSKNDDDDNDDDESCDSKKDTDIYNNNNNNNNNNNDDDGDDDDDDENKENKNFSYKLPRITLNIADAVDNFRLSLNPKKSNVGLTPLAINEPQPGQKYYLFEALNSIPIWQKEKFWYQIFLESLDKDYSLNKLKSIDIPKNELLVEMKNIVGYQRKLNVDEELIDDFLDHATTQFNIELEELGEY